MRSFELIKAGNINDDTKLYRYLSLSQFIEFIEKKKIYLTNINSWEDTWEAPAGKIVIETQCKIDDSMCMHLKNLIGQSWSLEGLSDALWRIYSKGKEGIMIQTSVKKFELIKGINYAMLAPVIYYDDLEKILMEIKSKKNYDGILGEGFVKRKAFEHEKEVRLITLNEEKYIDNSQKNTEHILLSLEPRSFIEGIIVDPRAKNWYVETIKLYCERAGLSVVPIKSDLYSKGGLD